MVKPSDRSAIVRLHKAGCPSSTAASRIAHSNVIETLVDSKTAEEVEDLVLLARRRSSRPSESGQQERTRSISTMAPDMGISRKSMERVVHEDLKMYLYRTREVANPQRLESARASQEVSTASASDAQQGPPFDRLFE
ncbi:hypothetical protein V3C99_018120 [Haemonchus contortus]|uniref:Uncharacterized protein n=1 Tax=Haemonchus contortus TaxID=6289 RepID=A0A7I4Z3X0_HAECO